LSDRLSSGQTANCFLSDSYGKRQNQIWTTRFNQGNCTLS